MPGVNGTWGAASAWGATQLGQVDKTGMPSIGFAASTQAVPAMLAGAYRGPDMAPLPAAADGAAPLAAAPWLPVEPQQAAQPERFAFVSDMMSQAADAPAGVRP